jgi:hypothetical protein
MQNNLLFYSENLLNLYAQFVRDSNIELLVHFKSLHYPMIIFGILVLIVLAFGYQMATEV